MPEDLLKLAPPLPDLCIPYGPDPCQFGELRLASGKRQFATVMNIHGGFWRNKYDLKHAGHFCAALSAIGFAVWNIEYRRVNDPGAGWPASFNDICQAWRFIWRLEQEYEVSAQKIIVAGHSAGAQLALCLAAREPSLEAVVSLAGIVDLERAWHLRLSGDAVAEFLGGSPTEVPQHYRAADPMRLNLPGVLQTLIHGTEDTTVPAVFSRSYCKKKKKAGEDVRLVEISEADHFDVIDPRSAAWLTIEHKISELVGR
ncbi:MAG: alpha/beta hydrolase [Acidobacteria bacterium]|nr:alpha/beta hydrolase [Acidobacteriota bacterium]